MSPVQGRINAALKSYYANRKAALSLTGAGAGSVANIGILYFALWDKGPKATAAVYCILAVIQLLAALAFTLLAKKANTKIKHLNSGASIADRVALPDQLWRGY